MPVSKKKARKMVYDTMVVGQLLVEDGTYIFTFEGGDTPPTNPLVYDLWYMKVVPGKVELAPNSVLLVENQGLKELLSFVAEDIDERAEIKAAKIAAANRITSGAPDLEAESSEEGPPPGETYNRPPPVKPISKAAVAKAAKKTATRKAG